jgi:hypothetical protein
MLSHNTINAYDLSGKNVGVICYGGDTARVATSILRAKGIAASSIKGGFLALAQELPQLQANTIRPSFQQWSKSPGSASPELQEDPLPTTAGARQVFVDTL